MSSASIGFALLVIAGIANANFATPMKFTLRWPWEITWFAWTVFALLLLPPLAAVLTVPHLAAVYRGAGMDAIVLAALFGAGWGVAQVFFGLAVDCIGIALTFSIVMGISAALGSLVPLLRLHPEKLNTSAGHELLAGVGLMIGGVALCALAGRQRERQQKSTGAGPNRRFVIGLVLALLCGLGASLINFGLAFGAPIVQIARDHGATPLNAVNAVWLPVMMAGALPNLAYCFYLFAKNGSAKKFSSGGMSHWLLALLMAVLWFGSAVLYGIATVQLGAWGPILGWPLYMSLIVISASLVGILTGEWKQSGARPLAIQFSGVALLVAAIFMLTNTSRYF